MRRRTFALLATLLVATAAAADPRDVVDECVRHKPSAAGLAALEAACPGLDGALAALGVRELLVPKSRDELDWRGLRAIAALIEPGLQPASAAPQVSTLTPILKDLGLPGAPPSWWERFKDWLRRVLGPRSESKVPAWLIDWFEKLTLPAAVKLALTVFLLIVIVAAAVVVVARELRASGVGWRAAERRRGLNLPVSRRDLTLADARLAPAGERARMLFRVVLDALVRTQRVNAARNYTHRELRSRVKLKDPLESEQFSRLASAAEAELFAQGEVPAARLEPALAAGTALYASVTAGSEAAS